MLGRRTNWVGRAGVASVCALGCYRHVPTTVDQAPIGSFVRVVVVADRTAGTAAGQGRTVLDIRGTLLDRDSTGVLFAVPVNRSGTALAYEPVNQRIRVAPQDVLRIELRQFDGKRTGGLVALLAGAAVAATITGSRVGGGLDQPTPPGDESVRGILQWRCCR